MAYRRAAVPVDDAEWPPRQRWSATANDDLERPDRDRRVPARSTARRRRVHRQGTCGDATEPKVTILSRIGPRGGLIFLGLY